MPPARCSVTSLAQLLDIVDGTLCIRARRHWCVRLMLCNAGMLTRTKKEYEWEELPADNRNRYKPKAKPGSLGEVCMRIVPRICVCLM